MKSICVGTETEFRYWVRDAKSTGSAFRYANSCAHSYGLNCERGSSREARIVFSTHATL